MPVDFRQPRFFKEFRFGSTLIWGGVRDFIHKITGNAPVTLTNAVQKGIKSLTQKGLCTQAENPTPAAPVDIKCNNGALKYGKQLTLNSTRIKAYINESGYWINSDDSYSIVVPVTVGKTYAMYFSNTTSGTVGTIFRYGFTNNRTPSSTNKLSQVLRTSPQSKSFVEVTADKSYLIIQMGSSVALSNITNGYFEVREQGLYIDGTDEVLSVSGINLADPSLYNGDGWYVAANDTVASANANGTIVFPCKPNTAYSWWHTDGKGGARAFELDTDTITAGQSTTWAVGNPAYNDAMTVRKYTTSADAKLLCILFARVADNVGRTIEEQLADFMLVEGDITTATSYEPYITPQTASVVDLFAVGDYADTQEIISGAITRKCGVLVLNGSESFWAKTADPYGAGIRNTAVGYLAGKTVMCSHYPFEPGIATSDSKNVVKNTTGAFAIRILVDETVIPDTTVPSTESLAAIRSHLAAQYAAGTPVIVIYPLAEETTETVTAQHLTTSEGTNIINVTAEVSPIPLEVDYYSSVE